MWRNARSLRHGANSASTANVTSTRIVFFVPCFLASFATLPRSPHFAHSFNFVFFPLKPPASSSSLAPPLRSHSRDTTSPPARALPRPVRAQIPTPSSPASNPRTSGAAQSSRLPPEFAALSRSAAKRHSPHTLHPTPPRAGFSSLVLPAPLCFPRHRATASASGFLHPAGSARQSCPFRPAANAPRRIPPHPRNSIPFPRTPASSHSERPECSSP